MIDCGGEERERFEKIWWMDVRTRDSYATMTEVDEDIYELPIVKGVAVKRMAAEGMSIF